jgi:HEAT repeat protein
MGIQSGADAATPEELFSASFEGDYDDEKPWEAVRALRRRGGDEVFRLAVAHSRSDEPTHRARALDVLAQLGAREPVSERPYFDESVAIATTHLADTSPLVFHSAAWALAHLGGEPAASALMRLSDHIDADVRLAVAFGLMRSERSDAICTLRNLMEDGDAEVRNWATFALANAGASVGPPARLGRLDSVDIREALRKRLSDSFSEVRDEAVWGLTLRKDPTGLRMLLDRMDAADWVQGDEMAAAELLGLEYDTPIEALRMGLRRLLDDQEMRQPEE